MRRSVTAAEDPVRDGVERAAEAFMRLQTLADCRRVVETERAYLLTDEAEHYVENALAAVSEQKPLARHLRQRLDLLLRCRRDGIDAAFSNPQQRAKACTAALAMASAARKPRLWAGIRCEFWENGADIDFERQRWSRAHLRYGKAI